MTSLRLTAAGCWRNAINSLLPSFPPQSRILSFCSCAATHRLHRFLSRLRQVGQLCRVVVCQDVVAKAKIEIKNALWPVSWTQGDKALVVQWSVVRKEKTRCLSKG